jgi:hypothetical protein
MRLPTLDGAVGDDQCVRHEYVHPDCVARQPADADHPASCEHGGERTHLTMLRCSGFGYHALGAAVIGDPTVARDIPRRRRLSQGRDDLSALARDMGFGTTSFLVGLPSPDRRGAERATSR